jgi:hypothetical protein
MTRRSSLDRFVSTLNVEHARSRISDSSERCESDKVEEAAAVGAVMVAAAGEEEMVEEGWLEADEVSFLFAEVLVDRCEREEEEEDDE